MPKCKHHGCHQDYDPEQNTKDICQFHPGPPIFRDTQKTWLCCGASSYDWDLFLQIEGCKRGPHTDVTPESPNKPTAPIPPDEHTGNNGGIRSIEQFNKELAEEKRKDEADALKKELPLNEGIRDVQAPQVNEDGSFTCRRNGCYQKYSSSSANEEVCRFHSGTPIFHDTRKGWSCCESSAYDWDDFMKLPKCCEGLHSPRRVKKK